MPAFPARSASTPIAATITTITTITASTTISATKITARFSLAPTTTGRYNGFRFAAVFHGRFARKFDPAFVVDPDALHPHHLADLGYVFRPIDPEIRQLGDVHEAIFARENFDEGAEFFDRDGPAMIDLADLHFLRHAADDFLRARHRFAARGVDVDGAVVFDINLRAGLGHDPLDRLAARSDERADLLRIDFDRLDARRVFAQRFARLRRAIRP